MFLLNCNNFFIIISPAGPFRLHLPPFSVLLQFIINCKIKDKAELPDKMIEIIT